MDKGGNNISKKLALKGLRSPLPTWLKRFIGDYIHKRAMWASTPEKRVFYHRLRGAVIGENVYLGLGVFMDEFSPFLIEIEEGVRIGAGTKILSHDASVNELFKDIPVRVAPVKIEKGAWIGTDVIILPGVTIGKKSLTAARAIVTKDVPPYTVVAGAPAKPIKTTKEVKDSYRKKLKDDQDKYSEVLNVIPLRYRLGKELYENRNTKEKEILEYILKSYREDK